MRDWVTNEGLGQTTGLEHNETGTHIQDHLLSPPGWLLVVVTAPGLHAGEAVSQVITDTASLVTWQ